MRILGRKKETIVLLGGENIEPGPMEDTICESEYISQAMVVGQDKRYLGALIVPALESLEGYAEEHGVSYGGSDDLAKTESLIQNELIQKLVNEEILSKFF